MSKVPIEDFLGAGESQARRWATGDREFCRNPGGLLKRNGPAGVDQPAGPFRSWFVSKALEMANPTAIGTKTDPELTGAIDTLP